MTKKKKKTTLLILSIILSNGGLILMIYDWLKETSAYEGSNLFYLAFLSITFGVFAFIVVYPKKLITLAYPFLVTALIYGYSYLIVRPKIKNYGNETKAVVVNVKKVMFHYPLCRGIEYEYQVNGEIFHNKICNKDLDIGDTFSIKYSANRNNFHVIVEK